MTPYEQDCLLRSAQDAAAALSRLQADLMRVRMTETGAYNFCSGLERDARQLVRHVADEIESRAEQAA